jgi:hypothetical protein
MRHPGVASGAHSAGDALNELPGIFSGSAPRAVRGPSLDLDRDGGGDGRRGAAGPAGRPRGADPALRRSVRVRGGGPLRTAGDGDLRRTADRPAAAASEWSGRRPGGEVPRVRCSGVRRGPAAPSHGCDAGGRGSFAAFGPRAESRSVARWDAGARRSLRAPGARAGVARRTGRPADPFCRRASDGLSWRGVSGAGRVRGRHEPAPPRTLLSRHGGALAEAAGAHRALPGGAPGAAVGSVGPGRGGDGRAVRLRRPVALHP